MARRHTSPSCDVIRAEIILLAHWPAGRSPEPPGATVIIFSGPYIFD
jgi:hypothetical protein